ncbi:MAG: tetratricopeptide repeat protein [Deltaproteobacteria bacterium]|nr:tetratricopeptide repeat protein [Deltaproteobacteria bacterium]
MSSLFSRTFVHAAAITLGLLGACAHPAPPPHPGQATSTAGPEAGKTQLALVGDFDPIADRLRTDPVADAIDAIRRNDFVGARALLEPLVAHVPAGWAAESRSGKRIAFAAWRMADVIALAVRASSEAGVEEIAWIGPSYSHAYGLLAYMAVEEQDLARAASLLDAGIALEPYPDLLSERGTVAIQQRDPAAAIALFERAIAATGADAAQQARAWRGKGEALIALEKLDDAERAFARSLELEPGNALAKNELEYIRGVREGTIKPSDSQIMH